MTEIYTNKIFIKLIIGTIIVVSISSTIFYIRYDISQQEFVKGIIIVLLAIFIPYLLSYIFLLHGRKLIISKNEINMGRRYIGPLKNKLKEYKLTTKLKKENLILPWSKIKKVYIGNWERWWARHWNIVTPALAGEKMSGPEAVAQFYGIPLKRVKSCFLIVETKESEFYAIELNTRMISNSRNVIVQLGKEGLLDKEVSKL